MTLPRRHRRRRPALLAPELRDVVQRLVIHYRGAVPAGEVIRCVAGANRALVRAGVDDVAHVEAVARQRLAQRCATRPQIPAQRGAPGVLALLGVLQPLSAVLG